MQHAIDSREKKLDSFFVRVRLGSIGEELTSDLARFGAVLVCGYVERCVEVIILDRLAKKAHERVLGFVRSHFKRGTNYDCEAICQLLARFDQKWEVEFRAELKNNDQWSSSLTSAYALRNSIAHGGDGSRGLAGIEALYEDCKYIVSALVEATRH